MILARAPLRIGFLGGGTDIPAFFLREGGAVVGVAITSYVHVMVRRRGGVRNGYRVYDRGIQETGSVDEIDSPIVREALRMMEIEPPVEIVLLSDVLPGTGLGSSSSTAVALLHALHALRGDRCDWEQLAAEACELEIERLGQPIGWQDQHLSAGGGLRHLRFHPGRRCEICPLEVSPRTLKQLCSRLLLFYLGGTRSAREILGRVLSDPENLPVLRQLRNLCEEFVQVLTAGDDLPRLGDLIDEGWRLKRTLGSVSNSRVDEVYERARAAGARGGKLLGAGGTGFLLLYAEPERLDRVRNALSDLVEHPVAFDEGGSRLIHVG